MAYIPKAERDKIPAEDFAGPSRTFPIRNQQDVEDAARLIGKAGNPEAVKRRLIAIAKRKGLKVPEAWAGAAKAKMSADFASAPNRTVEGTHAVYRDAPLFRSGSYPDQGIDLDREDLWAAEAAFRPGSATSNVEHTKFLAGKAAEVRALRVDPADPDLLRGDVAVPLWLDENLDDAEKKLSCEWDIPTRSFEGVALCTDPVIKGAALVAGFSAGALDESDVRAAFAAPHKTYHGMSVIQDVHDRTAMAGAVCEKSNSKGPARFHSERELKGIQKIHDMSVEHGARCSILTNPPPGMFSGGPAPKGKSMSKVSKLMTTLFGDKAAEVQVPPQIDEERAGDVLEAIEAEKPEPNKYGSRAEPTPAVASFAESAEYRQMKAEIDRARRESVAAKAEAFAEKHSEQILPANRDRAVALFSALLTVHHDHSPKATFSHGGKAVTLDLPDLFAEFVRELPRLAIFADHVRGEHAAGRIAILPDAHGAGGEGYDPARAAREQNDAYHGVGRNGHGAK